jgi:hypothetical protein
VREHDAAVLCEAKEVRAVCFRSLLFRSLLFRPFSSLRCGVGWVGEFCNTAAFAAAAGKLRRSTTLGLRASQLPLEEVRSWVPPLM